MDITAEQLEKAAKAAAVSEFDGGHWRDYIRPTAAALIALGFSVPSYVTAAAATGTVKRQLEV